MNSSLHPLKVKSLLPLHKDVLVSNMEFGERTTQGGIVLLSDNGKTHGIKPRWAKVYAIGPEQNDVEVGDWICIEHGRWTRVLVIEDDNGTYDIQKVDLDAILLVSKEEPIDDFIPEVNY